MPYEVQRRDQHVEVAVVTCLRSLLVLVHQHVQTEAFHAQVIKVGFFLLIHNVVGVQLPHKHFDYGGELGLLSYHSSHYLAGVEALLQKLCNCALLLNSGLRI